MDTKKRYIFEDRGSNWRKWDLHVHTASSYDYAYKGEDSDKLLVDAWKENGISVVAITDHFKIDANRIKNIRDLSKDEITVFPGVELRTDKGASNVHVILIFDVDCDIEILEQDFNSIMLRQKAKPDDYTEDNVYWDYEHIIEFAKSKNAVISIHSGKKTNGIDKSIRSYSTEQLPVEMAIKQEYAESVDIFEVSKKTDILDYQQYVFQQIHERPVIICSDNHDPRDYLSKEFLWIKAEPNFSGLKQAIIHPKERVYVGEEPTKITSLRNNPEKYLSKIIVTKKDKALNSVNWFDFEVGLNIGLTTVIGNKGNGKSAFTDMLGYIGKSKNRPHFSFLNKERFAKEDKKYNLDYQGTIIWFDGEQNEVHDFSLNTENNGVQLVRYLPQRYIEETCNSLDKKFQNEIDSVIFSYVDVEKRNNAKNLQELVDFKQTGLVKKTEQVKVTLHSLNNEIIKLEKKRSSFYKKECKDQYEHWINELKRHEDNKPQEVLPPEESDNEEELAKISEFNEKIKQNEDLISEIQNSITKERICLEELLDYKEEIELTTEKIINLQQRAEELSDNHNISPKVEIELSLKINGLESRVDDAKNNIASMSEIVNEIFDKEKFEKQNLDLLKSYDEAKSLFEKNYILDLEIEKIKEDLGRPQLVYQNYLDNLKTWEEKKIKIIGNESIQPSLLYFEKECEYLEQKLEADLNKLYEERKVAINELFNIVLNKKQILDEIYNPVEKKLDLVLKEIKDKVRFKASISVDGDFVTDTLSFINQSVQSKFRGKSEGQEFLESTIRSYQLTNFERLYSLVMDILSAASKDEDKADQLLKKRQEFYNYITSLSYLNVGFSLKMGDKELDQLSPGEKGAVLLIFYLALDKEDKPLIIDQPEDNLDNQSVFDKLVPCVLEAKKNRQVILVTHNPNLALACDSELIIYSKNLGNEISYTDGPIEQEEIKDKLVDILEGTMPAFDLRTLKYKGVKHTIKD
jgi:ABC transporter